MKRIDSDALVVLNKALGLTGAGSPVTELTDGVVDQVLDITGVARRSRTAAQTQGLFTAILQNVHPAGDAQITRITPYNLGVGAIAPFPDPIPAQFDLWIINACLRRTGAAGGLTSALLSVQYSVQGFGEDESGVAVALELEHTLAFWDAIATEQITFGVLNQLGVLQHIGLRLPRANDTEIQFRSTSAAAATFNCQLVVGLFPVALGQDAVV